MKPSLNTSDAISAIALTRSQSLTAIVAQELERRILTGEMRSGERFNEQSLAESLGVSRGPVREARRTLEKAGLLVSRPGRGSFVRTLNPDELAQNYDIRALLTGFACARIARFGMKRQKAGLRDLVDRMEEAISVEDDARYYALNVEFHDLLMATADHERAAGIYQDLVKETHLSRQKSLARKRKMRESNDEHRAIVDAIEAGDVERARQCAEAHVLSGKRRWQEATASREGKKKGRTRMATIGR